MPEALEIRHLGLVSFEQALAEQEALVVQVQQGAPEVLLLLEHLPVYTIGRTRDRSSLGSISNLPCPVFETNRGGQATYHGPGQLVGYPILDLARRGRDLHRYLRFLENFLQALCRHFGVVAESRPGLTGAWVAQRKIASIGVGVRHWVSMHGFALNVCNDLRPFLAITPCGIVGVQMTSLSQELGKEIPLAEVSEAAAALFPSMLAEELPLAPPLNPALLRPSRLALGILPSPLLSNFRAVALVLNKFLFRSPRTPG